MAVYGPVGKAVCTPCVLWALLYAPRVSCEGGCMHPVCLVGGWLYAPRVSYGAGIWIQCVNSK